MKPMMQGQVALITGASSGIGAALAREFARQGADIALCARRVERLESLARELTAETGRKALAIACDVTREGDLEKAVERTTRELGRLDVLVANAGFSVAARLEQLTLEDYRRQFETNVFGVLRAIYAALEPLKKTKGRIALMGSIAGRFSIPENTPYCMTKNALTGLATGLRTELAFHGVSVTHIMPGFTDTEIFQVDNQGVFKDEKRIEVPAFLIMPVDRAARQMTRAIVARKPELILTWYGRLGVRLQRFFPRFTRWVLARAT
jgi:short-subunit dehydrogenase